VLQIDPFVLMIKIFLETLEY